MEELERIDGGQAMPMVGLGDCAITSGMHQYSDSKREASSVRTSWKRLHMLPTPPNLPLCVAVSPIQSVTPEICV